MLIAVLTLAGISFLLATLLILAHRKWHVEENPLISKVEQMLPHNNCGACGYPGCNSFAQALVEKKVLPVQCTVGSHQDHEKIAQVLGVEVGIQEKKVARLACAGGNNVAKQHAVYSGLKNCRAASLVAGGGKNCSWGCLGYGDCQDVCQFNAIHLNNNHLPVVEESNCTACNDCVEICPKDLFSLHPVSHRLWVACNNQDSGDDLIYDCEVACTACGRCAHDAQDDLITMKNNLPIINYNKNHNTRIPIERCPTGAIIWIAESGKIIKGRDAKTITRHSAKELDFS